jgi:hypothetical protein
MDIVQVHAGRLCEVFIRFSGFPAFSGRDALDAVGQRGIACGQRFIEAEIPHLFGQGEALVPEEHGEHGVGLFEHLPPVNHEGW